MRMPVGLKRVGVSSSQNWLGLQAQAVRPISGYMAGFSPDLLSREQETSYEYLCGVSISRGLLRRSALIPINLSLPALRLLHYNTSALPHPLLFEPATVRNC